MKAVIKEVGPAALQKGDPFLILFEKDAAPMLRQVAVLQQFTDRTPVTLQAGQQIKIGDQEYTITFVGPVVNENLATIGHTVLVFDDVPAEPRHNGVYLTPKQVPQIKPGMTIIYGED